MLVLHRPPRRDVVPGDLVIVGPLQDCIRGHTIVFGSRRSQRSRSSSRATRAPEIAVSVMERQALARAIVDHDEDTQGGGHR